MGGRWGRFRGVDNVLNATGHAVFRLWHSHRARQPSPDVVGGCLLVGPQPRSNPEQIHALTTVDSELYLRPQVLGRLLFLRWFHGQPRANVDHRDVRIRNTYARERGNEKGSVCDEHAKRRTNGRQNGIH